MTADEKRYSSVGTALSILRLLTLGKGVSVYAIGLNVGVNHRTVYRFLKALEAAGVEISKSNGHFQVFPDDLAGFFHLTPPTGKKNMVTEMKEKHTPVLMEIMPKHISKFEGPFCRLRGGQCHSTCRIWVGNEKKGFCLFHRITALVKAQITVHTPQEAKKSGCFIHHQPCLADDCAAWVKAAVCSDGERRGGCALEVLIEGIENLLANQITG
jgi:hypothetical protein